MSEEEKKIDRIAALPRSEQIERTLVKEFDIKLWRKFIKAIAEYHLVLAGDRICVCISGGKDSMLMALLFKHLKRYSDVPFDVHYLVMNPGYNDLNLQVIKNNLKTLDIPATIVETDIFDIANSTSEKPCYLCAKMRRGALYRIAKSWGCNKIALGHHYEGMEIIRPLYLIREEDIIAWKNFNHLRFIQCACRFTENCAICDNGGGGSQRYNTKLLIQELKEKYSPMVEKNIFRAASNVNLDMILSYKKDGQMVSFLDHYEEEGKRNDERIRAEGLEAKAEAKAMAEHRPLKVDESFEAEKKE